MARSSAQTWSEAYRDVLTGIALAEGATSGACTSGTARRRP
ncbi:MAG TPA: hypothetical protein VNF50_13560 [Acidimicrobiales bacterium]|nr:hypothetical protein [Acidimicrobiales bacterium]